MASIEDAAARGPACQVEGCTNSLLNLRDYHLRCVNVPCRRYDAARGAALGWCMTMVHKTRPCPHGVLTGLGR